MDRVVGGLLSHTNKKDFLEKESVGFKATNRQTQDSNQIRRFEVLAHS